MQPPKPLQIKHIFLGEEEVRAQEARKGLGLKLKDQNTLEETVLMTVHFIVMVEEGEVVRTAEEEAGIWAASRGPNTVMLMGQATEEGEPERGVVGSGRITGYPTRPSSMAVHWEAGMAEANTN